MDESLHDSEAITVPVPTVDVLVEARNKTIQAADITHFVVQLSDKRLDALMQMIADIPYDSNKPWAYWFFVGKILSKAFFGQEDRLEWFNAVRVRTREFIGFSNTAIPKEAGPITEIRSITVIEVDFLKPQPGEAIKIFWKPARAIIRQNVENWIDEAWETVTTRKLPATEQKCRKFD